MGTVLEVMILSQRRFENLAKHCRFDDTQFCWRSSCDVISPSDEVSVCDLYRGGDKCSPRRAGNSHVSIFVLLRGHAKHGRSGF